MTEVTVYASVKNKKIAAKIITRPSPDDDLYEAAYTYKFFRTMDITVTIAHPFRFGKNGKRNAAKTAKRAAELALGHLIDEANAQASNKFLRPATKNRYRDLADWALSTLISSITGVTP